MNHGLRALFFLLVVRPISWVLLGLNVRHAERLPCDGPAVIIANHNSHLDTLVLMSLFPRRCLRRLRPVAAADYFLRWRWLAWFSRSIIGIIPLRRGREGFEDLRTDVVAALQRGDLLILFPEGTRGEPEQLTEFKRGVAVLVELCPDVPIIPIYLHGLGKALPKGEALLVPFFVDIFIGEPVQWPGDRDRLMEEITSRMNALVREGDFPRWE